jgi:hypothetical protein
MKRMAQHRVTPWLALFAALLAACTAPSQPPANAPASSEKVQPPAKTAHDGANQCVETSVPLVAPADFGGDDPEFKRRVEARLRTLKSCTDHLAEASSLSVLLEPGSTNQVERVLVTVSGTDDCETIGCVKQGLVGVEAPRVADHPPTPLRILVSLVPHSEPTIQDSPRTIAERRTPSCLDEPQPGRLPPKLIQSVVRAHYGAFRHCYEAGLGRNPRLAGRIGIRFVIARDGRVSRSSITENTLADCQVAACVRDEFRGMTFPPPEGGIVTVVYPIMLEPG